MKPSASVSINVKWGRLALQTLVLTSPGGLRPQKVSGTLAGKTVPATMVTHEGRVEISFAPNLLIPFGQTLQLKLT
jgi:hypothetical protein